MRITYYVPFKQEGKESKILLKILVLEKDTLKISKEHKRKINSKKHVRQKI